MHFDGWLPDPPDLSPGDLSYWQDWAATGRRVLAEITRAQAWRPTVDCGACRIAGETPPRDGCRAHHPYVSWTPNRWQSHLWWSRAEFNANTAGTRSGKSSCGAAMVTWFGAGIPPAWFLEPERAALLPLLPWPRTQRPDRLVWIGGPKRENLERGIVKYIRDNLDGTPWLAKVDEYTAAGGVRSTRAIHLDNGSAIEVRVQDQGIAAFMSASVDVFWEDEEFEGESGDDIRREARNRLTDRLGRYYFNATAINTALRGGQSDLAKKVLGPGMRGELNPREYRVMRASTLDNTHMPEEARAKHDRDNRDPVTGEKDDWYLVRVEGHAIGVNLSAVLPASAIAHLSKRARPPIERGTLTDTHDWRQRGSWDGIPGWQSRPSGKVEPRFIRQDHGGLWVWEHPQPGAEYTIGADAGKGIEGSGNPAAAWVYDRHAGRFVALLWDVIGAIELGEALVRLGWYYNRAYVAVGLGGPGYETVSYLAGAGAGAPRYDRLYLHTPPGTWETTQAGRPGFPEDSAADKERMFAALGGVLRPSIAGRPESIRIDMPCIGTLREMASIQRHADSLKIIKPSHDEGRWVTHCDRAEAAALAIVADQSPSCPLARPESVRPVHSDPLTEASIRAIERDQERQQREDDERRGVMRIRSRTLTRSTVLRRG